MAVCLLFLISLFLFPHTTLATPSADQDIFISEIQIAGDEIHDEFIELYNPKETSFSLDGLKLCRKTSTGSLSQIKSFSSKDIVPHQGFFLFAHSEGIFASIPADASTKSSALSENNSLAIVDFCDSKKPPIRILDSISWGSGKIFDEKTLPIPGNISASKSLVRDLKTLLWSISDSPTPTNSAGQTIMPKSAPLPDPAPTPSDTAIIMIRINEVFPNPLDEDDEWIELFNFGQASISLKGWSIADKTKSYPFDTSDTISPKGFFLVSRAKSGIAMNNTGEIITLSNTLKNTIDQVSYEKTIEGASLNYSSNGYRWSKTITPLAENILNNTPEMKKADIPDTAYINVPMLFSASGKDSDGEKIKYTWNFGDGHKSYKSEIAHRYEKKGKYRGTLTISDGTEATVTEFSIEVKKYEAPKIRLLSLVPNPEGKDTAAENIEIENRSKKSVDLLGWSIATGWKKLVNHPIRESFIIPGKSKRFLTREFSSFTLPNEKGKIELRSPDGKTVQKMKYDLKGKSAEENARLVKEKGKKWTWISHQSTESDTQLSNNKEQGGEDSQQTTNNTNQEREIDRQELQLQQDTEVITSKRERGEKLVSMEKNPREEMRKIISFGTDIETPLAVLDSTPRVAGAKSEAHSSEMIPKDFSLNAIINGWLARD